MWTELGFVTGFIGYFQLLITFPYGDIAQFTVLQFTRAGTESSRFAIAPPVIWYSLQTADVSIPLVSGTAPMP
jgi:hypothetical protein